MRLTAVPRPRECIRILSVGLLDELRPLVEEFKTLSRDLKVPLGWHYLLDCSWASAQLLHLPPGSRVLDAGAGRGLMQWWLSGRGIEVLSVDRGARVVNSRLRRMYPVQPPAAAAAPGTTAPRPSFRQRVARRVASIFSSRKWADLFTLLRHRLQRGRRGVVHIHTGDLAASRQFAGGSVDAVVPISSLEHNPPEHLPACVAELMRVLAPGAPLVATVGAAGDRDWFHEPSRGWCRTDATLRRLFSLPDTCPSNFSEYDRLMEQLRGCDELRESLAEIYFQDGDNGMPWGKWDPRYQSEGIIKIKPGAGDNP